MAQVAPFSPLAGIISSGKGFTTSPHKPHFPLTKENYLYQIVHFLIKNCFVTSCSLKGQSHEKVGEVSSWGTSQGTN
jgi:hypothetical protein